MCIVCAVQPAVEAPVFGGGRSKLRSGSFIAEWDSSYGRVSTRVLDALAHLLLGDSEGCLWGATVRSLLIGGADTAP